LFSTNLLLYIIKDLFCVSVVSFITKGTVSIHLPFESIIFLRFL